MRTKREAPCDYRSFSDPYTGLATMIFVQADNDLKMLNGAESAYKGGVLLSKWEIIYFFRSQWADTSGWRRTGLGGHGAVHNGGYGIGRRISMILKIIAILFLLIIIACLALLLIGIIALIKDLIEEMF